MYASSPAAKADTVSLVCALLGRFPELSSIRSLPDSGTVRLTFAVRSRLTRAAQARIAEAVTDHIEALLALSREEPGELQTECESDRAMSFVHVIRDLETFSKSELEMLAAVFMEQFGSKLVRNPVEEQLEEEAAVQDDVAGYAIEALRDPAQSKSVVGFREEARVLVYFLKKQKKAKASARR